MHELSVQSVQIVHAIPGRVRFRVPVLRPHSSDATQLQAVLESTASITSVRVNGAARSVTVYYSARTLTPEQIRSQITALICPPAGEEPSPTNLTHPANQAEQQETVAFSLHDSDWSGLRLPALSAFLAFLSRFPQFSSLRPLAITTLLMATYPIAVRSFQSLAIQRRLNIDCLDLLALSLSAWQRKLLTPALVITLHELGDIIREQTARSTELRTASLMDTIGHFAWVKYPDQVPIQIPSDRVQVGDTIVVYPGEQIPVDGTVCQGEAVIDQQSLTGESMPVVGRPGQKVFASTLVRSGQIYIEAERVGNKTRAAASIELLQQAPVYDTRMANYAEKLADRLIMPSLLLAGIVLAATRDPARAASILTLDFVTGVRVSIPTAFLGALNHTTQHGILVRSGRTLEQLADVDTVVFDKTGTLTQGSIAVSAVQTVHGLPASRVLQLAAAAEQRLNHPVADAIVQHAKAQGLEIPVRGEWSYEVGLGVKASIEGHEVLVGSERFLQQADVDWIGWDALSTSAPSSSAALIYVACDRQFQGTIQYTDPLRPESATLIQQLQTHFGIEVHLLTGDNRQRAAHVASELGIPSQQVYAEAFPEQKADIVRNLRRSGRTVAFVGDGLNDSVALAYADVSVSFEHGSDIARETADVVLMNNCLLDLLEALSIARQTRDLIEQNTALVVAPNLVALGLASTVGLNPLVATAIHNGSAIVAGLNSLRPLVQHQIDQGNLFKTN